MNQVQEIALQRALSFLTATGLQYAIKMDDGGVIGSLPIKVEPTITKSKRPKVNDFKPTMYREITDGMQPGTLHEWAFDTREMCDSFRKVLASRAGLLWGGRDNYITTVTDKNTVEILRIS